MSSLAIDTLRYAKRLRAAGFTEEQAEIQAEALSDAVRDSLVTKLDLNEAVEKLRGEIAGVRREIDKSNTDLRSEIENSANTLRIEIRDLHNGLIRWLIPLLFGQVAATVALIKLL